MASVNKAIVVGNLGRDPEIRYTQNNTPVATFSIATTDQWSDRNGEKQERTEWHRIVAWGRLAEICSQYLQKGKQVYVEGRLQTREWEDKDGNKRYTTEIVAQTMQMLGRPGDGPARDPDAAPRPPRPAQGGGGGAPARGGQSDPFDSGPVPGVEDEDLPF